MEHRAKQAPSRSRMPRGKLREGYEGRPYLTLVEAADFLGISPWTLREMARMGKIKRIKVGARVLFDRNDLIFFMESQKQMQNLGPYRQPHEKHAP